MRMLLIPDPVAQMNIAAHGDAGRAWLAALPALVAELEDRWQLTDVGPAFEGGVVGFVAPAVRRDREPVVVKISYVEDETRNEADALAFWDGHGAVGLLDADRDRGASPGTVGARHLP